ncbi:hypothetical protein ABFS82_13G011900 [Erythranthe guttata]|uniref:Glycosyltransferase n=1 Tax=Erythranthe guttata TaxID=4155 RepID=A0A022RS25_ERYGU|nr:PREDICTED: anthocyanidin 3-O-glucosyltransferase 2-like [Erythranthe guttata]EYU42864.1 hypothetical protein MIMGU_mgv1a020444mg [Erythranthe guttata]|eukprot:XP_012830782.1 PREDICTED: anthocyanidin 3-O-glucosyltransferase 2-like [Erythranthe guttata]
MSMEQKASLIFIPFPVMSHLVAAVKAAKLLSDRDRRLSITVLVIKMPFDTKISSYINMYNSTNSVHSRINFVHMPENESVSAELLKSPATFMIPFIESQKGFVRNAVSDILTEEKKKNSRCAGFFIIDMVCISMMDLATEFEVPSYLLYISAGAAILGLMFHLQELNDHRNQDLSEYEDSSVTISAPTYAAPFPAKLLPELVLGHTSGFLGLMRKSRQAKGFIVNTFLELEPHAILSFSGEKDEKIPPVYPVGPLITMQDREIDGDHKKYDEIIGWLDEQPDSSVVFLCFGSSGYFEVCDQLKEIALALERSGRAFLWALRKPPVKELLGCPGEYEDPREVLPEGFLERTVGIGRVIAWAPQMAILSHRAVGGFVSHCGWNSVLESVSRGVPIAAWPLAVEQANAFQLVEEIGVGVDVKMDYRKINGVIVSADVIEGAIGRLMDPENEARVRVEVLKEKSRIALMEGGSSYNFLGDLIADIMDN